ncbi:hypothetical protein ACFL3F_05130 [Planctomycetota bacterium]
MVSHINTTRTLLLLSVCLLTGLVGCEEAQEVVIEPDKTLAPAYIDGREEGARYLENNLADYEVVAELFELNATERQSFLDGFARSVQDAGHPSDAVTFRQILLEAITGNQFSRASEMGSKHVLHTVTNEQVQGVIHSSLGVSRGVVLGWKAGYIKGFKAQRVAQTTAKGSVDEEIIEELRQEAAATYFALRAAIGG